MSHLETAEEILGWQGQMVAASKLDYMQRNPDNIVVFNSNICTASEKIWYGDIDITKDRLMVDELAVAIGEKIYVLREMDARFENEDKPLLENAVYCTSG